MMKTTRLYSHISTGDKTLTSESIFTSEQTPIHSAYTESAQQRESHRNGSGTSRREERRRHRRDRTKTDRVMLKNVLKHLISLKLKVAPEMTSSG